MTRTEKISDIVKNESESIISDILKNESESIISDILKNESESIISDIVKNESESIISDILKNESESIISDIVKNESESIISKQKKISIVMSYINRREQLEFTLKTISYSKYKDIEIIIHDDASNDSEQIDDFVDKYGIKLLKVSKQEKNWINPVVGYNNCIREATGEIIIIQNPEVCHMDDILFYINENLNMNEYYSFSCYALANNNENIKLQELMKDQQSYEDNYNFFINQITNDHNIAGNTINNKPTNGWVNHNKFLPTAYHYLCAIHKENLIEMGYFDMDYQYGLCHDDDDFIRRLVKHNFAIHIIPKYCVHQWHPNENKMINFDESQAGKKLTELCLGGAAKPNLASKPTAT